MKAFLVRIDNRFLPPLLITTRGHAGSRRAASSQAESVSSVSPE